MSQSKEPNTIKITPEKPYTVPKGKILCIGNSKIPEGTRCKLMFSPAEGIKLYYMGVMTNANARTHIVGEQE